MLVSWTPSARCENESMKIGKVSGTVVSTINAPVFEARRLLLCDLLDETGKKPEAEAGYAQA